MDTPPAPHGRLLSVNLAATATHTDVKGQPTGIGKLPVARAVHLSAPGPKGVGGSGVAGDMVCDRKHHGGDDQAVYAYAREDLDWWQRELGRDLPAGMFGENLTTLGLDLTGALVGERWRVGDHALLEVACPRIPCAVFAEKMGEAHWVKRFTERGATGAYLRVIQPGPVRAGDPVTIEHRPDHQVTLGLYFRAVTTDADLLDRLLPAGDALPRETRDQIARRSRA